MFCNLLNRDPKLTICTVSSRPFCAFKFVFDKVELGELQSWNNIEGQNRITTKSKDKHTFPVFQLKGVKARKSQNPNTTEQDTGSKTDEGNLRKGSQVTKEN